MLQVQFNLQHLTQTAYLFDQLPFSIAIHMNDFPHHKLDACVHARDNKTVEA